MMRAIGQAGQRLATAEEEFGARGIADRPMAGGLVEFQQRQPLAHRHHIVVGDRIRLHLDVECVSQRGVAARHRPRNPHHLLGGPRLALARSCRGGALGAAGKAKPVDFADYRVSRDIPSSAAIWLAESPPSQSFFSCSTRSSDQVIPSSHSSLASRRPVRGRRCDANSQISLRAESLSPRRAA